MGAENLAAVLERISPPRVVANARRRSRRSTLSDEKKKTRFGLDDGMAARAKTNYNIYLCDRTMTFIGFL